MLALDRDAELGALDDDVVDAACVPWYYVLAMDSCTYPTRNDPIGRFHRTLVKERQWPALSHSGM
jgi:hypothetical protein